MIVREKKTAFNGAHCEAGVKMSQAKADKYLVENAHIYSGYATLDAPRTSCRKWMRGNRR